MPTILNIFLITAKDVYLKVVNLLFIWAGLVTGSLLLSFVSHETGPVPLFVFPILMTAFLSLFYMEWLISNEKEKATFLWLRTLPVSDRAIVSSKLVTLALLLAVHPLAVLPSVLINPANLLSLAATGIVAVSVFSGCVWGMLIFLLLKGANKYIIPLLVILLLSLVALMMMQSFPWLPEFLMTLPTHVPWAILLTPFSWLLGWWLACRIFENRDSADLVD